MKFKLIKDKEFFQIVCDQKSVKEIIDGDNKSYEIEWYASTKDKDRMNDVVEPTAFEETLKQYMTNPIVLLQHDMDKPIGNVVEASIDEKGLFIRAKITEDTDWVFSKLKNGVLRTFSIWYRVKDFETVENVNSDGDYSYTNIIKSLELFEISLVSVPANPFALIKSFDSCFKAEEEIEEKEEEKADETVTESEETEEKVESEEVKEEEKTEESENTEKEESEEKEEFENIFDDEKKEESEEETKDVEEEKEEIPNEEAEQQEICEEENENKEADEQSEIPTEVESQTSENDAESASNDESNGETNDAEVVEESKSMEVEHKSIENAEFKSFVKSFNEKLDEKEMQIKSLEKQVANQNELIKWAIEVMMKLDHAIKNTAVQSWSSYNAPATKNSWWYGKIAELLKSMHNSN